MQESGLTSSEERSKESSEIEEYLRDDKPFQLVVREKPRRTVFFRAKPITAYRPTEAQIRARITFAKIARRAKGRKMSGQMPPAAEEIKKSMSGMRFGETIREPKWLKILKRLVE